MGNDDDWTYVGKGKGQKGKGNGKGNGKGKRQYVPHGGVRFGNQPYENDTKWKPFGERKPRDQYTYCTGCCSFTWDRKKGPTCGDCGLSWAIWDGDTLKEVPKGNPNNNIKHNNNNNNNNNKGREDLDKAPDNNNKDNIINNKGREDLDKAPDNNNNNNNRQAEDKYGKYGNPAGKAETRDEARKVLGEANVAFSKLQGVVQKLQK